MMSAGNDFSIGGYYEFGIGYAVNDDASLGFSTADAEMKKSKPKPLLARRPPHLSAAVANLFGGCVRKLFQVSRLQIYWRRCGT